MITGSSPVGSAKSRKEIMNIRVTQKQDMAEISIWNSEDTIKITRIGEEYLLSVKRWNNSFLGEIQAIGHSLYVSDPYEDGREIRINYISDKGGMILVSLAEDTFDAHRTTVGIKSNRVLIDEGNVLVDMWQILEKHKESDSEFPIFRSLAFDTVYEIRDGKAVQVAE